jgi:hypothetical protein
VIDLSSGGVDAIEYMQRIMKALDAGVVESDSEDSDGEQGKTSSSSSTSCADLNVAGH